LPQGWRIRVHNVNAGLVADSAELDDKIEITTLAPLESAQENDKWERNASNKSLVQHLDNWIDNLPWQQARRDANRRDLPEEVSQALTGQTARMTSYNADDVLMASVSVPIRRVQKILGSLTIETDEVAQVISKERQALLPFIGLQRA